MKSPRYLYHECFASRCTLTIFKLSRMRRNVTRLVYYARKSANPTTSPPFANCMIDKTCGFSLENG